MNKRSLRAVVSEFLTQLPDTPPAPVSARQPELPAGIAVQLGDQAFSRSNWTEALSYYREALQSRDAVVDVGRCMLFGGRAALYLGEHTKAQELLATYAESFPSNPEGLFYLGRAYQGVHRYFDALNCFQSAALLGNNKPKYLAAVAQAAHSLAFQGFGYADDTTPATYIAIARAALDAALAKEADHFETLVERMLLDLDCGAIDAAIATCGKITEKEQKFGAGKVASAATNLALALARGGLLHRVVELGGLEKSEAGRRLLARARSLARTETAATDPLPVKLLVREPRSGEFVIEGAEKGRLGWLKPKSRLSDAAESISLDCDLVLPRREVSSAELTGLVARTGGLPAHFAGLVKFRPGTAIGSRTLADAAVLILRKAAWNELVTRYPSADWETAARSALERLNLFVVADHTLLKAQEWPVASDPSARPNRVLVLSRNGPTLMGGGEHFLRIAGQTYARTANASVFFAGLTKDVHEVTTHWPETASGIASGYLEENAETLRVFCIENRVDAVHVISGLGTLVLDAVAGLDIRIVYGVHFWREFIPARVLSRPYYPNVTLADAVPLPEMHELIARADFAYVNSDFCSDLAKIAYAWSPPIIHSVPVAEEAGDLTDPQLATLPNNFVLLANARADKGWHLMLNIAALLPETSFVAIAGQSDRSAAQADVHRRGLYNVHVLGRTNDMDKLYERARVVLVPSFTFVETFSRVVIEAGRAGRPVLMADSGNLSYLGRGTDLVLPNDPQVWANRVMRIGQDEVAYKEAAAQSIGIARRHSARMLRSRLKRIPVRRDSTRVLVAVGSGIGNICHTTPMIQRLVELIRTPVDVLVGGDFSGSDTTVAGAPFVGQVFEDWRHVRERRYDVVLVTHSFGSLIPDFNAYRVIASRDLMQFDPAGDVHESEFNLAFLEAAMGAPYAEKDVRGYFFGAFTPRSERNDGVLRIGLHAGSKAGVWAAKRWPGFAALGRELSRRGAQVLSVGIPTEYVEGTLDETGHTIERMAEVISTCDAIVSNDSGIMNIANAIGVPVLAIFGPTNPVTRGPLKSVSRVLSPLTACAPCEANREYSDRFTQGTCRCVNLIGLSDVLAGLADLGVVLPPSRGAAS